MKVNAFTTIGGTIIGAIIIGLLAYGGWNISRWWNYSLGYEDMVQRTVCEMVKPEYLVRPCDKQ